VDDRETPALFLELVDMDRPSYLTTRARDVFAITAATRLTCWDNLAPDRADLPRRLREFGWLAVYEAGADFVPPPPVDRVTGLHFVRTSRPGQGRLVDEPTQGLLLVLISPRHVDEAQLLRDWADFVHLRHIAEATVPGYTMVTPYESADHREPRFLHFYEMCTNEAEKTFQTMTPLVATRLGGYDSPAFEGWAQHPALVIDYVSTFALVHDVSREAA
jgi:hypothetical protein